MALYKIDGDELKYIKVLPFKKEKEIQKLTENNLRTIFGLEFVTTEFPLDKFRIDTLSFNKDEKSFVIIEYKRDEKFSIIDQGYAYLASMLNRKADVVLEYNERLQENLSKKDVDWSQSRVIFISPNFTIFQKEAINLGDLPIELWEIERFSNKTVNYSKLKISGKKESIKTISDDKDIKEVSKEIKVYTEEKLLYQKTSLVKDLFMTLKDDIFKIDANIEEKITKSMACYYSGGKGMVWIHPYTNSIRILLRKGDYEDKFGKIKPDGWGGYPELTLTEDDLSEIVYIKYVKDLIRQAYDKQ